MIVTSTDRELVPRPDDIGRVGTLLRLFPVTAILGPRQSGKTTLARMMGGDYYLDLEDPADAMRLESPQIAFERLEGLIVIDEVQRMPSLFPLLRTIVDSTPTKRFLILGSASPSLVRWGSESLAGRIGFHQLGGLRIPDVGASSLYTLWVRGGFPRSFLASSEEESVLWRENFVRTFLERDIPSFGIKIPAMTLRRFWTMLAHFHGQIVNFSEIARSFGVSDMAVRRYLEILQGSYMIRLLAPWHANIAKRTVKRPKLYFRDSGLFHCLLSLRSGSEVENHPKLGASWEGFAVEAVVRSTGKDDNSLFFWATHTGAEVDLFWIEGGKMWAVECKYVDAPRLTKSMVSACADLALEHLWVVYPGKKRYRLSERVSALPITEVGYRWSYST